MNKMQNLILVEDLFDELKKGKACTIRSGRRDIQLGDLEFQSLVKKRKEIVNVNLVYYCSLIDVMSQDILNDGFENHLDMFNQMRRFYPDLEPTDEVTVIRFKPEID